MPDLEPETSKGVAAGGGIAAGRGLAAARRDLIELVLSWGASVEPSGADLLDALSRFDEEVLAQLGMLSRKGRDYLPAPLWDQVERAAASLPEAGAVGLDETLARAGREVATAVDRRREAILSELKGWAPHMDFIQVSTLLDRIWRTEGAATMAERLAAADALMEARGTLEEVRRSCASRLQGLLDAPSGVAAPADLARQARAALDKSDALEMSRALAALADLGRVEDQRRAELEWRQARASLEATCARARQSTGSAGASAGHAPGPLVADALREAERALQDGSAPPGPTLEASAQVLRSWDTALGALLNDVGATGEEDQKSRQAIAEALQSDIAEHVAVDLGLHDRSSKIPVGDLDGTARKLLEVAISGGGSFQEAFENALALARKVRGRSETHLKEASSRLRSEAAAMEDFLDKAADQLPTARVVRARLWLDQVEGIIASAEIPSMASTARSLADDLKDLERLLNLARKRRDSREGGERESLQTEAARLLGAAPEAIAGRIKSLAGQMEKADGKTLASLREQLDKLGAEVEQAVRLEAGRALHAGSRLLPRGGNPAAVPAKLKKVDALVASLREAMGKDDLAKIVSMGRELSSAVSSASPISRRPVRIALAAAGVIAVAGGLFGWRQLSNPNRPQTFHLRLSGKEQQSAVVRLARDGRFIGGPRQAKGDEVVDFALEPGRYEVFVNDRFTGRIVQVPGPSEVGDIPVP